jgi:hypothetical protein
MAVMAANASYALYQPVSTGWCQALLTVQEAVVITRVIVAVVVAVVVTLA